MVLALAGTIFFTAESVYFYFFCSSCFGKEKSILMKNQRNFQFENLIKFYLKPIDKPNH
jgi:hypothetical protein